MKNQCDKQMDGSLLVKQTSGGGGGDTAAAPLAYFSLFTPLGGTICGGSSATLGLSLQDSKVMAAH